LLADFAAQTLAVFVQQFVEGFDFFHHHQVIQILASVRKMLANISTDFHAQLGQFAIQYRLQQRGAPAATGAGLGLGFQAAERGATGFDCAANLAFADIVTGANLRRCG